MRPISKFLIFQGYGFFRYRQCRFKKTLFWLKRAYAEALKSEDSFALLLSQDLMAHTLIQTGEVARGLKVLDQALVLAIETNNRGVQSALQATRVIKRAQFGIQPRQVFKELNGALEHELLQNNYSKTNLLLELAHQYSLRGKIKESQKVLSQLAPSLRASRNRRQQSEWYFRKSLNAWISGSVIDTEVHLEKAKSLLSKETDLVPYYQVVGFLEEVRHQLGKKSLYAQELKTFAQVSSSKMTYQILQRQHQNQSDVSALDNPMGQMMDALIKRPGIDTFEDVISKGYLGLLRLQVADINLRSFICLDVLPSEIMVCEQGQITMSQGLTPGLKKLALTIAEGPISKEQLIEKIWGYSYDPLRHDSLIYSQIQRLRTALGNYSKWLLVEEGLYSWQSGVSIFQYEHSRGVSLTENQSPLSPEALNYHELKVIGLAQTEPVNAQDCMKKLQVSKATATKILTGLKAKSLLVALGKGRATRYQIR